MNFEYKNGNGRSYAKTSGSESVAINEYATWQADEKSTLTVWIEKVNSDYSLRIAEAEYKSTSVTAACYYQISLAKK